LTRAAQRRASGGEGHARISAARWASRVLRAEETGRERTGTSRARGTAGLCPLLRRRCARPLLLSEAFERPGAPRAQLGRARTRLGRELDWRGWSALPRATPRRYCAISASSLATLLTRSAHSARASARAHPS